MDEATTLLRSSGQRCYATAVFVGKRLTTLTCEAEQAERTEAEQNGAGRFRHG